VNQGAVQINLVFAAMWLGWLACWGLFSLSVKTTARRESPCSRFSYIIPLSIAAILLAAPVLDIPLLGERFLLESAARVWGAIGIVITLSGLLFTVWARVHLGRNWSGTVTIKEGHELITSGPYRFVRHPIYTGLLLAFIGQTIAVGQWRGMLAVVLATYSFWRKLRIEERWMREHFGSAYDAYSQRVSALIPFIL
jgi:protein-S-isoprenylcysteine O-methyltransferase Ste14